LTIWCWSSYPSSTEQEVPYPWLNMDCLLAQFGLHHPPFTMTLAPLIRCVWITHMQWPLEKIKDAAAAMQSVAIAIAVFIALAVFGPCTSLLHLLIEKKLNWT